MHYSPLKELLAHRRLLWLMTLRDLKARYAGSLMGVFWTVITPLLLLAVFSFIGIAIINVKFGDRAGVDALYIFCGVLSWLCFNDGLARSATVVVENKNLVTRALFPPAVLPVYPAVSAMLGQLAGFGILAVLSFSFVEGPSLALIAFPLMLLLQLVFTAGLCMAVASVSVYVRDLAHVLPVLLLVWMFATPIFYKSEALPASLQTIINLNPLALFIQGFRSILLQGSWPEPAGALAALGYAAASLIAGSAITGRLAKGLADRL